MAEDHEGDFHDHFICLAEQATREKHVAELVEAIGKLRRGCDCEYDYRCSNCNTILRVKALSHFGTESADRDVEDEK